MFVFLSCRRNSFYSYKLAIKLFLKMTWECHLNGKYCQDRKDDADAPRTSKFFWFTNWKQSSKSFFFIFGSTAGMWKVSGIEKYHLAPHPEKRFFKKGISHGMSVSFWGCQMSILNYQTLRTLQKLTGGKRFWPSLN